ncbi:MAG TPA: sigma-70 family RNA polymerase sigma factor [Candidatus Saccharimonadales bacterium]|nr:sigma-70 family RNA polymerase sigma factor [Candidatus Saccharimonadales bacterium]
MSTTENRYPPDALQSEDSTILERTVKTAALAPLAAVAMRNGQEVRAYNSGIETSSDKEDTREDMAAATADLDAAVVGGDDLRTYMNQVGKTPLLTKEKVVELAQRIEAGLYAQEFLDEAEQAKREVSLSDRRDLASIAVDGERAKNHLLEANLRLVISIAKRYTGRGLSYLDLIQEGNLGLIRAVEKFDYKKGYTISTYATWWIRQAVTRALHEQSRAVRLPIHKAEELDRVRRARRELTQDLGREPTRQEVAWELDVPIEQVTQIELDARSTVSLDQSVGDESDKQMHDYVADPESNRAVDNVVAGSLCDELERVLHTFTDREAGFIRLRFGLGGGKPRTVQEVASIYGLTPVQARAIDARTMAKLYHPSRSATLHEFLR